MINMQQSFSTSDHSIASLYDILVMYRKCIVAIKV